MMFNQPDFKMGAISYKAFVQSSAQESAIDTVRKELRESRTVEIPDVQEEIKQALRQIMLDEHEAQLQAQRQQREQRRVETLRSNNIFTLIGFLYENLQDYGAWEAVHNWFERNCEVAMAGDELFYLSGLAEMCIEFTPRTLPIVTMEFDEAVQIAITNIPPRGEVFAELEAIFDKS